MRCRDFMKAMVACITPTGTVEVAARRMRDANIGFLPVCDANARVVGTLTDRDIAVRIVADRRSPHTCISDVMTREVVFCHPDDDVQRAEELMAKHQKSRILCCDEDGRLVGVVSLSDLAKGDALGATQTLSQIADREAHAS